MNLTPIYANTLIPRLPKLINDNFEAVKEYIDIFYDGSNNIILKPVNTTGRIKATTGEFVNVIVDNLTVKKQYTNMYENITTSDIDFVTVYNGSDSSTRSATDSSVWPYENPTYLWIDATQPYFKITNLDPIAIQNDNLGQVVRFIFDASASAVNNFQILLDPCSNSTFEVTASDSSALYLELITVDYDASWGPTWVPYKFGRLDASFAGGGGGGVGPGTVNYIPKFYTSTTVGNSNLHLIGTTLYTNDVSASNIDVNNITLNNTIKDVSGNILLSYGSPMQINDPNANRDVSIYGYTGIYGSLNIDGSLYVDGSLFVGGGGGTSVTEFAPTVDNSIAMVEDVGGLTAGTTAGELRGQSYDLLLTNLLFPTAYPTLTNPFNTFSSSASALEEIGDVKNIIFSASFNRGTISPAYGTSGYRSGLPNTYTYTGSGIDGSVASTLLTDNKTASSYTILIGTQSWTNTVSYDIGEQPLDNKGNPYSTPLPAGTTSAKTVTVEGVYPLFGTTSTISNPDTQQPLISMLTGNRPVFSMPVESGGYKQSFDIPTAWSGAPTNRPLTNVETYNTVSGSWESTGLSTWSTSSVTHDVQGNTINYTRYTYNGANRGDVQIRLVF